MFCKIDDDWGFEPAISVVVSDRPANYTTANQRILSPSTQLLHCLCHHAVSWQLVVVQIKRSTLPRICSKLKYELEIVMIALYINSCKMGDAIAQWIHMDLPSYSPVFESQAHHQCDQSGQYLGLWATF